VGTSDKHRHEVVYLYGVWSYMDTKQKTIGGCDMDKILKDIARSLKDIADSLKKIERNMRADIGGDITINIDEIKDDAELEELVSRIADDKLEQLSNRCKVML
jgi:hypothetical protein